MSTPSTSSSSSQPAAKRRRVAAEEIEVVVREGGGCARVVFSHGLSPVSKVRFHIWGDPYG